MKPRAEKIIAEEQAGFRAGRTNTKQIFNLRILCEEHLQHQQNLYHVSIDFKKVFDKVWHAALWATIKKYNISANLIRVIRHFSDKATGAVLFQQLELVRQGCLLSPTLFSIFLERIMADTLEDRKGTVSIGSRTITNLRFAEDIDGLAGEGEELAKSVERLDKASTAYGMEIRAEKTKLMTNNTPGINTETQVNGQKLETVTSFKYLGSVTTDEGSKPEILSRIAQTTAAMKKLKPVWNNRNQDTTGALPCHIYLHVCL